MTNNIRWPAKSPMGVYPNVHEIYNQGHNPAKDWSMYRVIFLGFILNVDFPRKESYINSRWKILIDGTYWLLIRYIVSFPAVPL